MNKFKLKSRIIPFVTLCVVFFTTFFATYAAVRSVIRNSHADNNRTLTVTKIWQDNDNIAAIRPNTITVHLVAQPVAELLKVGTVTITDESTKELAFTPDQTIFSTKQTSLTNPIGDFYHYVYDSTNQQQSIYHSNFQITYQDIEYSTYILLDSTNSANHSTPTYPFTANIYVLNQAPFTNIDGEYQYAYHAEKFISSTAEGWVSKDTNTWEYQFTNLDPSTTYQIYEESVPSYTSEYMGESNKIAVTDSQLTITNTFTSAVVKSAPRLLGGGNPNSTNAQVVKIIKQWNDQDNASGNRPSDITLHIQRQAPTYNTTATFMTGRELNAKLKQLVNSSATNSTIDTTITAIKKATALPAGFTPTTSNTISAPTSANPIYIWLDGTTAYYYTVADGIYLNQDATGSFANFRALTDISGLTDIDVSRTTTFHTMFQSSTALTNVDALAGWDVSNANSMWGMFENAVSLTDISGLTAWDMSNATNVKFFFGAQNSFTNTSSTPMQGMQLTDLTPLKYWNLASANDFDQMFKGNVNLVSLEGLDNWDTSNVIAFRQMFENCVSLTAEGTNHIVNWTVPSSETSGMFQGLPSSIIPNFTGNNAGSSSGASGGSGGSSSSGTAGGETTSYTENGWTKNGNTWEKEIVINPNYTYTIYEDSIPLYATDASILNPKIITGDTITINNSLQTRDITVTKVWDDQSNLYNARPENISVHLNSINPVPAAYQQVEYIESNGTQYINTGLTGNTAYTFYTDGFVRRGGNGVLINNYVDNNNRMGGIIFNTSTARTTCYWIASGTGKGNLDPCISGSNGIDLGSRFQLTQNKSRATAVQGSNTLSNNYNATSTGTNSGPIYLFHSDQANASSYTRGVLYGAKIYDGDNNLLRDFYPVYRKADNTIGMYDVITGTFFTNTGSGTFLKGANVDTGSSYSFVSDNSSWDKSSGNTWTYTFKVPDDGSIYQAYEDNVPNYSSDAYQTTVKDVTNDAVTITNTVNTRTINLTKIWDDTGHVDARPNTINARLFTIDTDTGQFKTIANANNWTKSGNTWTASITLASSDDIYVYEDAVYGYLSSVTPANPILIDPNTNTASFTNKFIESPREITIFKQWQGDTDYTNLRTPPTVHLDARDNSTPANATLKTLQTAVALRTSLAMLPEASSVATIAIYSNGHLPPGFTLTQLQALPSIDVSDAQDGSVMAYADTAKNAVYIYSADQVAAPANSQNLFALQEGAIHNYNLIALDVAELDTSQVTNMLGMFSGNRNITYLNLSNFDTSNVTNMQYMFYENNSLRIIIASNNFVTTNVTNDTSMFYRNFPLTGSNGTLYTGSRSNKIYARIDAAGAPGYFTAPPDTSAYHFVSGDNWRMMGNVWSHTFTVPDDRTTYEVYEEAMTNYNGDALIDSKKTVGNDNQVYITNTLKDQEITVTKVWNDTTSTNRPATITAHLVKATDPLHPNLDPLGNNGIVDTEVGTSTTWIDNGDNTWTTTFTISIGETPTNYYVYENAVSGYSGDATSNNPQYVAADGTATITNTEVSGNDITIKKLITGNMASASQDFSFTVTLYDDNGSPVTGTIDLDYNGTSSQTVTLTNGQFTKTLKADQYFTIMALPNDYSYQVTEANSDYATSYRIEKTNETDPNQKTIIAETTSTTTTIQTPAEPHTVTFTNNKDDPVPSGAFIDLWPWFILALTIIAIGGGHRARLAYLEAKRRDSQTFISFN